MKKLTLLCLLFASFFGSKTDWKAAAIPNPNPPFKTANDYVPPYNGAFGYGSNMGYYAPHTDETVADFAARGGATTLRPALFEHFVDYWGYDLRVPAFQHYAALGMKDLVLFLGYPAAQHRDNRVFCGKDSSALFANLYEPIWDKGENGTPVNDQNYYALYVYKIVKIYGKWVKFWEIWNEPDYANTYKTEMAPGLPGAWWNTNPDPCEYALHAPIQHYIRLLRVSYEVIKSIEPDDYVCTGGIGFPSFLDILCRQTDNPEGGTMTPQYPLNGGAYFDVVSYHTYPHIDGAVREWSDKLNGFAYYRHSDRAADGVFKKKRAFETVLNKFGYDGVKYPQKHFIITECNIPRLPKDEFMGSARAQANFLMKCLIKSQMNKLLQFHVYSVSELTTAAEMRHEFDVMGLFTKMENQPKEQVKILESGIAYRTTSEILSARTAAEKGSIFNAEETKRLELPTEIEGAAFKNPQTGKIIYCLWARTQQDQSETVAANFSFPTYLNIPYLEKREWNFSKTKQVQVISSQQIKLTGTPVFFTKK